MYSPKHFFQHFKDFPGSMASLVLMLIVFLFNRASTKVSYAGYSGMADRIRHSNHKSPTTEVFNVCRSASLL